MPAKPLAAAMTEYEELRIRAFRTGSGRFLVFANGPEAEAAVTTLERPAVEYRAELAALFDEEFGKSPAQRQATTGERLRELGRDLFRIVLPEPVLGCLKHSLEVAKAAGHGLRLCFDVPAELMDLPFEALCAPANDFLGELSLQPALSIVRSLPGQPRHPLRLPQPEEERQPLSIIVVVSSPKGPPALQVHRQVDGIRQALPPALIAMNRNPLQVLDSAGPSKSRPTGANLENLLRRQAGPCALVLIAHGGYDPEQKQNVVLLEARDGSPDPVPAQVLRGLLTQASGLRLAVLNLCLGARSTPGEPFSGTAQSLIAAGVPAVVAMQMEVSTAASSVFGPALVDAICRNRTIDEAVAAGRRAAAQVRGARIEWANPVLYMHRDCGQGWLFKMQQASSGRRPPPDSLRQGQLALERFAATLNLHEIPAAAFFLKQRRNWQRVLDLAAVGLDNAPSDTYERLSREAAAELHLGRLETFCAALGREGDVAGAAEDLAALRDVLPPSAYELLTKEFESECEAAEHYRLAAGHLRRENWQGAIEAYEALLQLRPGGYREASQELVRARDELAVEALYRQAEAAADREQWDWAVEKFQAVLSRRPKGYRDAAVGREYATGRIAETAGGGDWRRAQKAYRSALDALRKEKRAYRDLREREAYARGRLAEEDARWRPAAQAYGAAKEKFPDAGKRLLYATARAAEQEAELQGGWEAVARAFTAADPSDPDVTQRRFYAEARAAEEEGSWQLVLDAFGSLPLGDDDRDGDVGRRRGFARAKLAEAEESWSEVVAELGSVPADFHGGEALILRSYGEGRRWEAKDQWGAALAAYELAGRSYRDAGVRACYARGRQAEEEERWAAAAEAFGALPELYREDVAPRRRYAEARVAEERPDWEAAVEAYRRLAAGFRDVAERLPHAEVRRAEEQEDWQGVVVAAAALPAGHGEAARLIAYAEGRQAEEREDWLAAAAAFARCAGYADGRERWTYAGGRQAEQAGEWSRAIATWAALPPEHRDLAGRRERLGRLLEALPWGDGLAAAGLAADPCAGGLGLLPYAELKAAGIHAGSPAETVTEGSFVLMEKGSLTPEARLAWDRLRTPERRLRVDALLYPLADAAGLAHALEQLAAGPPGDLLAALCAALPADSPLFLLLAGRRPEANAGWDEVLAEDPSRAAAAHGLALSHFYRARELEAHGAYEQAESAWRLAIAHWAMVLTDDAHWDGWRRERAAHYSQPVTAADAARLRSELGQELLDHLTDRADRAAAEGHSEREQRYRELVLALELELEGARLLKEVGGLRVGEGSGSRLACGLLYLGHRRLGALLGHQVAELETAAGDAPEQEDMLTALDVVLEAGHQAEEAPGVAAGTLFRLRCAFSELGSALLLLDRHQPEQAMAALPPLYRQRLADLAEECPGSAGAAAVSAEHLRACAACLACAGANPAYLCLPHRPARRLQDAVELATRAHLAMAQTALTVGGGDLAPAFQRWHEAVEVSRNSGTQVRTKRAIVRVVLGRAQALAQERGARRGERLTAAIDLVERARGLIGGADQGQLAALAAKLLTDRGVWYGYGCHEYENPDYERAAEDLRRALALTPDSLHARDNLSRALIFQAANLQGERGGRSPLRLLAEAIAVLHEGLCRTAGHGQLVEMLQRGLDELEECVLYDLSTEELAQRIAAADGARSGPPVGGGEDARQLAADAARRRAAGDETGELMTLITAVRRDAADDVVRRSLLDAVKHRSGEES